MGNTASSNASEQHNEAKDSQINRVPRRRESIQVLPHSRSTAAPPSATLEKAQGSTVSRSNTRTSDHSPSHPRSSANHARKRSQTSATPVSRLQEAVHADGADSSRAEKSLSPEQDALQALRSASPSQPVKVAPQPQPLRDPNLQAATLETEKDHGLSPHSYMAPSSHFARPPRMPLPIERHEFSPGSPIMPPADFGDVLEGSHEFDALSAISADEEEQLDDYNVFDSPYGPTADIMLEWRHPAKDVYVTGSFSGWRRKHRLQKGGPSTFPNAFSTIVSLPIGTHHLTFVVDGTLTTNNDMPTAVDYANFLVNYIAVTSEDAARSEQAKAPQNQQQASSLSYELPTRPHPDETYNQDQHRPPPTPELRPTANSTAPSAGPSGISSPQVPAQPRPVTSSAAQSSTHLNLRKHPERIYHTEIPKFLLDLDTPEDSLRHQRADAVLETQPWPPSLPMMLNKSILNGNLPIKDDSSVLHMPNHTVLNHLSTSSIRNGVLATAATTRYKHKYVTTILYRPTNDSND